LLKDVWESILCFVCKSSQYTTVQSKCSRIRTPLVITCFLLGIANVQSQGRGTTFPVESKSYMADGLKCL
jgi:hypothetical protein